MYWHATNTRQFTYYNNIPSCENTESRLFSSRTRRKYDTGICTYDWNCTKAVKYRNYILISTASIAIKLNICRSKSPWNRTCSGNNECTVAICCSKWRIERFIKKIFFHFILHVDVSSARITRAFVFFHFYFSLSLSCVPDKKAVLTEYISFYGSFFFASRSSKKKKGALPFIFILESRRNVGRCVRQIGSRLHYTPCTKAPSVVQSSPVVRYSPFVRIIRLYYFTIAL